MMKLPALVLALTVPFFSASALTLIQDGKPAARIYLSEDSPYLQKAVEDLNYHFEKMSGSRLEVVTVSSPAEIKDAAIVLGELAIQAGVKVEPSRFQNSIRILKEGDRLLIAGETPSVTVTGIYTFLSELGCDWVMPGVIGEVIPRQSTVTVADLDIKQTPSFWGRNLWYRGGIRINTEQDAEEFHLWRMRQRMDAPKETPNLGAGHAWDSMIKRYKDEFEKDSTMLALVRDRDGNLVRKGPQLESTHPGVVELFIRDIKEQFAKKNWPKDKEVAFAIGPADGLDYSLSSESALAGSGRVDPLTGSPDVTDLCVLLGNEILSRIGEEYPNVSLGYYTYSVHGDYPVRYKPHPRLNQIFAPINYSRYHSPLADNSKTWPYYVKVVEQWSELAKEQGNKLSYRGYNWNLAENMVPYSKLRIYGEEIPWYHDMGFIAVNIEATKAWAVNGPSDYLLAKLLWDADQEWRPILKDYCRKSFGGGAGDMEAYLLDLTERQHNAGQEAGSYHALHLIFDRDFVRTSRGRIEKAMAAAETSEEKTRASYFLYPLEQLDLYLQLREAFTQFDFSRAAKLYEELQAAWERAYAVNTQLVAKEVPGYLQRYLEKFIVEGVKYSSAPYRMVVELPDELTTQWDSAGVGERLGYSNPNINDAQFLKTKTWSMPWDAQGLGGLRTGAIWYRFPFETPGDLGSQGLGLFIGGVEDQVDVWLNGTLVGSSPRGFSVPFAFDLTEAVDPQGRNVLVMKVSRLSAANEIGLGGIIRPSFLFAGPRLEQKETPKGPEQRVLPGGELAPAE